MKYAPANEAGEKPYVVTIWDWSRERTAIVYADNANDARYAAVGRKRPGTYAKEIRRVTA